MKRWIAVTALALLVAGCATAPSNIEQPYVTQSRSTCPVTLDRYGPPVPAGSKLWIYVDGTVIGHMSTQHSTTFYLRPGPHSISLAVGPKPVSVNKARTAYVTVRYPVGPIVKVLLVDAGAKIGKMRVIRTY